MRKRKGSKWRVPPEFSGTINDNWLTHALDQVRPKIEKIIIKAFSKGQ